MIDDRGARQAATVIFLLYSLCFMVFAFNAHAAPWVKQSGDRVYMPDFEYKQPGQIAALKLRIADSGKSLHPYVRTGVFFPKGAVAHSSHISARYKDKNFPIQVKIHNRYRDNSIRFAIVTIEVINPKKDKIYDVALIKDRNKTSLAVFQPKLNTDIAVIITTPRGEKQTVHLKDMIAEKKLWQSGPLLYSRRYHALPFKFLAIDFDIDHFRNGHKKIDIIFHYNRLYGTPMYNTSYRADIVINGKIFKSFKNITQTHHTKWRYPLRFGYKKDNVAAIDMGMVMAVGALPTFDLSFGTSPGAINDYFAAMRGKGGSLQNAGLLTRYMPQTGTRDEIAILPQWTAQYVMSLHDKARYTMLKHAEIAATIPWHFYDSNTNSPAIPPNHPKVWIDHRASLEKHGIAPYPSPYDKRFWVPDIAHQPSLTYIPFMVTGDRYHYDSMKAIYMFNRLIIENTQNDPDGFRDQYADQPRAYGWARRTAGEMESLLDEKDPDASYIMQQNIRDLDFMKKAFLQGGMFDFEYGAPFKSGKYPYAAGEMTGFMMGYTPAQNPIFMQDLAAIGIGFYAGLGFNDGVNSFVNWQSGFVSDRFLQRNNGYPPEYGSVFNLKMFEESPSGKYYIPDARINMYTRWRDAFNISKSMPFFKEAHAAVEEEILPGYARNGDIFTAYARASNAQIFNVTGNPNALEAYGFLAQYFPLAEESYAMKPAYLIVPRFLDGKPLKMQNLEIGSSRNNDLRKIASHSLVHGRDGDDIISLDARDATGFLFGGDGNDVIYAAGQQYIPDYLFENDYKFSKASVPTAPGSYIYGGAGDDQLISGYGNDYLKGDENLGKGRDIFTFVGRFFGDNVIADFSPGYDKIKFCHFTKPKGSKNIVLRQITRFDFNNRTEGLSFSRRDITERYDAKKCDALSAEQRRNIRICQEDLRYKASQVSEYEFFKEIAPDFKNFISDYKNRLKEELKIYQRDTTSDDYLRRQNLLAQMKEREKIILKPDGTRYKFDILDALDIIKGSDALSQNEKNQIITYCLSSKKENISKADAREQKELSYLLKTNAKLSKARKKRIERQCDNKLVQIQTVEDQIVNRIRSDARFGDKVALDNLNNQTIFNVGVKNYFRKAPDGGTLIDLMADTNPEEYARHATHSFKDEFKGGPKLGGLVLEKGSSPYPNDKNAAQLGGKLGSVHIKNIPPEKLTKRDFIFESISECQKSL
ncbi:MAG: hypothetical protein AAF621_05900 [Pseudomonadota bacterium]